VRSSLSLERPGRSRPVRVLLNPAAGGGRAARRVAAVTSALGLDVRVTSSPSETAAAARRAADEGRDRILVAGGDGTVHHAVRGLVGTSCALGIIPVGGGNDLARALGVDLDPIRAARGALDAEPRRIDLGRVAGRSFCCVLGLGIDGEVSRKVRDTSRWLPGRVAYAWATLSCLARFRAPWVHIEFDGGRFEGRVLLAALANSPLFGGGMSIAPAARLDDGWLDLVIVERVSLATALRVFPRIYRGSHVRHPAVQQHRFRRAILRSEPCRTFWADGEPVVDVAAQGTPIDLWPGGLRVLA